MSPAQLQPCSPTFQVQVHLACALNSGQQRQWHSCIAMSGMWQWLLLQQSMTNGHLSYPALLQSTG